VVDEVLAVGDAEFQKKAVGKMQDVSTKDGRTILFVSHNMAAVKSLCGRGVVLKDGYINFNGTADEAVDYYLTNNQNPTSPLNERTDRFGNGKFKFTNINFYNRNGEAIHEIISGDYLKIKLDFTLKDKFNDNKFFFSIVFKNNYDQPVLRFISDELGFFPEIKTDGSIILEVDKFTLRAGSYHVRLLATHRSTQTEDMMDVIENTATFNVLAGDVFKTGKINRPGNDVIIPASYSLQD
jgi:lipopolysaccharide transport system ATP-binding protein